MVRQAVKEEWNLAQPDFTARQIQAKKTSGITGVLLPGNCTFLTLFTAAAAAYVAFRTRFLSSAATAALVTRR